MRNPKPYTLHYLEGTFGPDKASKAHTCGIYLDLLVSKGLFLNGCWRRWPP